MITILWTDEAKRWLKEIHDFIAEDNPYIAKKVTNEIIIKSQSLKSFPQLGQRLFDWPNDNIRMILYGHYRNGASQFDIECHSEELYQSKYILLLSVYLAL